MLKAKSNTHTETVTLHKYAINSTKKSLLGLKEDQDVTVGVGCPRCGDVVPTNAEHFSTAHCPNCHLHMEFLGNAIVCSEE